MHLTQNDFSLFGCTSTDILKEKLVCVCVQEHAGICQEFIVDLNNTSPDGESLKARPMKNSTSVLWFCSADPLPCANAAGPTAHTKPTHTHSLPLCRLCAVVETLWTLTSSLRDRWETLQTESGNIVPGNDITLRLLSLLYHRDGSRDCRMHQSGAHPTPHPPKDQRTQTKCRNAANQRSGDTTLSSLRSSLLSKDLASW